MKKFNEVERVVITGLVSNAIEAGPSDGSRPERLYQRILRTIRGKLRTAFRR